MHLMSVGKPNENVTDTHPEYIAVNKQVTPDRTLKSV